MKLSEAERDTLLMAQKGDGSFHTTVEDWEIGVCQPLEKAGYLSTRRVYEDQWKRTVWSYEVTPAGLKALEEE